MVDRAEFERRFKARIIERLLTPLPPEEQAKYLGDPDWEPWTREAAADIATGEWEAVEFEDHADGFEDDPEGAADESLSAWSD